LISLVSLIVFIILVFLNIKIAFALGMASLLVIWNLNINPLIIVQRVIVSSDSFPLLAIPFYILAGILMGKTRVAKDLIEFLNNLFGRTKGGLGYINVVASMFFGGMSGSAVADTTAIGAIIIPPMIKEGYDTEFTAAVTAASGTIGMIIPPSIGMIILGVTASISIGELFLAGIMPGILLTIGQVFVVAIYSYKRGYPAGNKVNFKKLLMSFIKTIPGLMIILIIVGGIYGGIFTPTEAGVVAAIYVLILGLLIYKDISIFDLPGICKEAGMIVGVVMLMVGFSATFAWVLAVEKVPELIASYILHYSTNPIVAVILMIIALTVIGTLLDPTPTILVLIPILMPIVNHLRIDHLVFGMIFMLSMAVAELTPPVGVVLYATASIARCSIEEVVRGLLPFYLVFFIVMALIICFPGIATFIPYMGK